MLRNKNIKRPMMGKIRTKAQRIYENESYRNNIAKVSYLPSEYYYGGKQDDSVFADALAKFEKICDRHRGDAFDIDFSQDSPYESEYKGKKLYGMGFHLRLYIHEDEYERVLPTVFWSGIIWDFGDEGLGFYEEDDSVSVSSNFRSSRTNADDLQSLGDSLAIAGEGIASFGKAMEEILKSYKAF